MAETSLASAELPDTSLSLPSALGREVLWAGCGADEEEFPQPVDGCSVEEKEFSDSAEGEAAATLAGVLP